MRFWLTKGLGKPIQEQLSSQLLLGILSGQLKPGQRLPSLKHLARRLSIHANTVSIVYGDLCERGWLVSRPGSGVFVAEREKVTVESFVARWIEAAHTIGITKGQLVEALANKPAELSALVVDPDLELARILAAELSQHHDRPFEYTNLSDHSRPIALRSEVWCNPGRVDTVSDFLAGKVVKQIPLRSIDQLLEGQTRPDHPVMIAVISRSQSLRDWASMLLPALGISVESILVRDPATPGWSDGLGACEVIAADIISERDLPTLKNLRRIRIVAP